MSKPSGQDSDEESQSSGALRREPSLADVDLSRLVSSRLRGQLRRSSSSGFDEPFSLQTPALHIPEHLWHPHAFRLASSHLHIPSAGCKALVDTWADACRRIRAAIHQPYLPWWGKLSRHRRSVVADTLAGLTAGVMLIPQGMAYAMIAALPPIIGLYTASVAPFVYALLGTSQQLSVGPVSLASIYFPTVLENLGILSAHYNSKAESDAARVETATMVTFWVGVIFLLMGLFKLGLLIRYLSHSVMTGFTTAAGAYVGFSQIKYILDIHLKHKRYHYQEYHWVITHLHESNPRTVILGAVAFAAMLACKVLKRRFPATPERSRRPLFRLWRVLSTFFTLIVVVLSAVVAAYIDVPVVGTVKQGLSELAVPPFARFKSLNQVLVQSIPVALLGYMEAYAVGRKYAEINHYEIDSNQDLFALGLANLATSFFGTYVASGSFARTALNAEAGARTPFSNIVLGGFIILTLTCLSGFLYFIPMAVLGAVIENAILNLIDVKEFMRAFRIAPLSFVVMLTTFLSTFLISIEDGLLIGVVSSVIMVIYQLSTVDAVPLGIEKDLPGLRFVSIVEHTGALRPLARVHVVRPVASLFFGNAHAFRRGFHDLIHGVGGKGSVDYVLVDCCAIKILDLTAMGALLEVVDDCHAQGVTVLFSNCSHSLKRSLEACDLLACLGGDIVTCSTEEVYAMVVEWLAQPGRSLKELQLTWEGTGAESKDGWGEHVYLDSTPSLGQQLVGMRPFHSVRGFMAWRKGEGAGLSPATVELNS